MQKRLSFHITPTLCVVLLIAAALQTPAADDSTRHWGIVPLPIVAYSPDTGGMFGIASILFYGPDVGVPEEEQTGRRNNTASINGIVTTKGSYAAAISGTNYFLNEKLRWDNALSAQHAPAVYYGVGPDADDRDEYVARRFNAHTRVGFQVASDLFVGPSYDYEYVRLSQIDLVNAETVYSLHGAGGSVIWDTTGGAFWPTGGTSAEGNVLVYPDTPLVDGLFGLYQLRVAQFVPVGERHVLGLQGRFRGSWGDTPFFRLPAIGGDGVTRGILDGRYRDTVAAVLQAEYRIPLNRRFAVVGFASASRVGGDAIELVEELPFVAGGIGFRIALNAEQRVNLRIDIAVAPSGVAPYVSMGEAF